MKRRVFGALLCLAAGLMLSGCSRKADADRTSGAPPAAQVEREGDSNIVNVPKPELFSLAVASERREAPELTVTGVVSPDISRSVPALSLASGRAVEVKVRLGDTVKKGQLLMRVRSADVAGAYSEYRQAVASETLAKTQLDRANLLLQKGAIAKKDQEIAADAEIKARVTMETAVEKLRVLGVTDLNRHPDGIVDIVAPISGVVTEQNIAEGSAVKTLDNSPNLFTIANLDRIWIVCDVYENSFSFIQVGEYADVRLNAYPDKVVKGRISNISPILDSNTRTAKVRIEIQNPGFMRIGMFATATFHGREQEKYAVIPASSILHLRDRQWVFVPEGKGKFRRTEVVGGKMLEAGMQQVKGLMPGQQVVADALRLQNMAEE